MQWTVVETNVKTRDKNTDMILPVFTGIAKYKSLSYVPC